MSKFTVCVADGYVKVYRGADCICAAPVPSDGKTLRDIEFTEDRYGKAIRTRIAAMNALRAAGYK